MEKDVIKKKQPVDKEQIDSKEKSSSSTDTIINGTAGLLVLAGVGAHTQHDKALKILGAGQMGKGLGMAVGYNLANWNNASKTTKLIATMTSGILGSTAGVQMEGKQASLATVTDQPWGYTTREEFLKKVDDNLAAHTGDHIKAGLAGAAILAGATAQIKRKNTTWKHLAIAGVTGYALGHQGAYLKTKFDGPEYGYTYTNKHVKPGDSVVIAVSGAGLSDGNFDRQMYNAFGSGKYAIFRWNETDKMKDFVNSLPEGAKAHVIGYSWGGSALSNVTDEIKHKDTQYHFIDPVGWNLNLSAHIGKVPGIKYNPEDTKWTNGNTHNIIRTFGKSHNYKDSIKYRGDHCNIGPVQKAISRHANTGEPIKMIYDDDRNDAATTEATRN